MENQIVDELQSNLDDAVQARALAEEMLELTDAVGGAKLMMISMCGDMFEKAGMDLDVFARVLDESMAELASLVVPTMIDLYTVEDLRTLVEFHRTPLARKMLANREALHESIKAAAEPWGERFASKLDAAYGAVGDEGKD